MLIGEWVRQLPSWFVLAVIFLLIVLGGGLVVIAFKEGREISFWPPRIGPRPTVPQREENSTPVVQEKNWHSLPEEDMQEIVQRVKGELDEYVRTEGITEEMLRPSPPELSDRTINLFKMKIAIGRKIREVALRWGGGWAGSSLASFETFFDLVVQHHLISDTLIEDIRRFHWLIVPGIYGDPITAEQYYQALQLAGKILRQLDKLLNVDSNRVADNGENVRYWEGKYSEDEMQIWLQRVLPVRLGFRSNGVQVEKIFSFDFEGYILHINDFGDIGVEVKVIWNEDEFKEILEKLKTLSKLDFIDKFLQYSDSVVPEPVIVFVVTEEVLAYEIAKKWKKDIFQKVDAFVVVGYWDGPIFNDVSTIGAFG